MQTILHLTDLPLVSVITPTFNSERFVEETILSVLGQTYPRIEYIILDGGSTDGTVDIIRKYEDRLAFWASEPDEGMYDAIAKGFIRATGDIHCYLNSDDIFHLRALETVASIFADFSDVSWFSATKTTYYSCGLIRNMQPQLPFRPSLLRDGFYNRNSMSIQQESTFWRSELTNKIDLARFREFRFAGDAFLWSEFSRFEKHFQVIAQLSGIRKHDKQLHVEISKYRKEIEENISNGRFHRVYYILYRAAYLFSPSVWMRFFGGNYISYDSHDMCWKRGLWA